MWPLHTSATITLRRLSCLLIGWWDLILASDWRSLTPPCTGDNLEMGGGKLAPARFWWHQAVESWSKSELMIIAIIIFLRPKVVQSISQMLISRCAWFIGHAANWAFYQETKCGNTKIPYILFIQRIKGYLWVYGLWVYESLAWLQCSSIIREWKCHHKGIIWLGMDGGRGMRSMTSKMYFRSRRTLWPVSLQ